MAEPDAIQPHRHEPIAPTVSSGLYVHVPFCETKCGYCDFYSVAAKDRDTAPLVCALIREMQRRTPEAPGPIRTIFFGGGTPTILPMDQLRLLLDAAGKLVRDEPICEFTVEANPATVDDEKAALLHEAGVTRVSMGAQSFFPDELAVLERLHSPDDIAPSVATLRRHGVQQVNLDLIFGIPGQTLESWATSIGRAMALEPEHIACYGLTYEPSTRLTALRDHGRLTPCDEDLETEQYLYVVDTLDAAGYEQYETSNFARPGCRCEHNLIYWRNQPYIGVGPSAAGCYAGRRYKNIADVGGYVRLIESQGVAEQESEFIDRERLMLEMLMMQLRLVEGLSIPDFQRRIGEHPRAVFGDSLLRLEVQKFLTISPTNIALTRSGRLVADAVLRELAAAVCVQGAADRSLPVIA
jgi:oxygen-independent coproporphyrinogen-3 oxidase